MESVGFVTKSRDPHVLLLLSVAYTGNNESDWVKLSATGKAEQSAHERERFFHRLAEAKCAPDLATLNSEITNYERTGPTLALATCVNGATLSKLALALPSSTDHKTLGKLVSDTSGQITIATFFALAKQQDKSKKSYAAATSPPPATSPLPPPPPPPPPHRQVQFQSN